MYLKCNIYVIFIRGNLDMLKNILKFWQKQFVEWKEEFFSEPIPQGNPFACECEVVLERASDYLISYMEEEISKVLYEKQALIFTNNSDMPFKREDEEKASHLKDLLHFIENNIERTLDEYEAAYLTYIFYNDVEEAIMRSILYRTLFKTVPYTDWNMYIIVQKLGAILQSGQEILISDLQELYAAYSCKKIWQYHMG